MRTRFNLLLSISTFFNPRTSTSTRFILSSSNHHQPTLPLKSHFHLKSSIMAPKKRQPEPTSDSEQESKQEDSKPPSKKQKQSSSSNGNASSSTSSNEKAVSKKAPPHTEKAASKGKGAPGAHPNQSDYNPNRGKLPKDQTPTELLNETLEKHENSIKELEKKNGNVVYWMRMRDVRLEDNRALSHASQLAQKRGSNLVVLHILSPADLKAHDTSSRKTDFLLRNLKEVKSQFESLDIPMVVLNLSETSDSRASIVEKVIEVTQGLGGTSIFANKEFEVNELWRDVRLIQKIEKENKGSISVNLYEDTYVVPPGKVVTKENKPYSVFSPWNKNWINVLSENMDLLDESPLPKSNDSKKIKSDSKIQDYLKKNSKANSIPESIEGLECQDSEYMSKLWPSGYKSALKVLENFFNSKSQGTGNDDLEASADQQGGSKESDIKKSRVGKYGEGRNIMSCNGTSRLSPYLTMGIVSARHVLRETMKHTKKLNVGRDSGIAMFNTEISFRDFYGHVLSAFPRVCMGRCYIPKYEDVIWNYSDSELKAWKEGKTGYPIVDASMRQMKAQGYMHNRGRMIVSMFLTKHLLHDWREGEVHFMQNLIDCDLASNNGGWQWSASTGTDPQPYFRIFNPLSQSEKSDPDGEYIRHWVPELSKVKGKAIHAPYDRLDKKEFEKLGYPKPIVEHTSARKRALARFKNPGNADDE